MSLYPQNNWIVMIIGEPQSGKTSFVQSVSEYEIPQKTGEPKVAMDFGRITLAEDEVIYLLSAPGSPNFHFMREVFTAERLLGYVQLIDSTAPQCFHAAYNRFVLYLSLFWNLPFVFAATKQDEPGAWSPDDIRLVLRIHKDIPILPCVATDTKSVRDVLIALSYQVLEDIAQAEQTLDE